VLVILRVYMGLDFPELVVPMGLRSMGTFIVVLSSLLGNFLFFLLLFLLYLILLYTTFFLIQ